MKDIALARSEEQFQQCVKTLKGHPHWSENVKLQNWFNKYWLSVAKRWVLTYRDQSSNVRVTTTNGLERKHQDLKRNYISNSSDKSVSTLASVLVTKFIPDNYKSYVSSNIKCLEEYKKYSEKVPAFLRSTSDFFRNHCMSRIDPDYNFRIKKTSQYNYSVFNPESGKQYNAILDETACTCSCPDWYFHHLPCKHLLFIMCQSNFRWEDMSSEIRNNPLLSVDRTVLPVAASSEDLITEAQPLDTSSEIQLGVGHGEYIVDFEEKLNVPTLLPQTVKLKSHNALISECCTHIKNIRSNVYLIDDYSALNTVCNSLKMTSEMTFKCIPKDSGLPIDKNNSVLVQKDGSRKRGKLNSTKLPRRKKYTKKDVKTPCSAEIIKIDGEMTSQGINQQSITECTENIVSRKNRELTNVELDDIQASDAVMKLWFLPKDLNVPVAKVSGMNIYDSDIRSLRPNEWLTDMVLDSYLAVLATVQNDLGGKVVHCVQSKMTSIINGNHAVRKHGEGDQIPEVGAEKIIGIYYTPGHWTLVITEMVTGNIFYYNPTGEHWTVMKKIEKNWKKYMDSLQETYSSQVSFQATHWTVKRNPHTRQFDSCNCGVYCLLFAEKHLSNQTDSMTEISEKDINDARLRIAKELMLYEVYLEGCCPKCGFILSEPEESIQCNSCKRQYHFTPFCIEEELSDMADSEDFICRLCRINFWGIEPLTGAEEQKAVTPKIISKSDKKGIEPLTGAEEQKAVTPKIVSKSGKKDIQYKERTDLREERKRKKRMSSFIYETPKKKSRVKPEKYCVCEKKDDGRKYWQCEACWQWFHPNCMGLSEDDEPLHYFCIGCKKNSICEEKEIQDLEEEEDEKENADGGDEPKIDMFDEESDEEDDKNKIDDTFIKENMKQVIRAMKEIMSCDDTECDEQSHQRHHQFTIRKHRFQMMQEERKVYGYGLKYFTQENTQKVLLHLTDELMYTVPDKRGEVSLARIMMLKGVPEKTRLARILSSNKVIALKYLELILWREALALIVALKTGMPLEASDQECRSTLFHM